MSTRKGNVAIPKPLPNVATTLVTKPLYLSKNSSGAVLILLRKHRPVPETNHENKNTDN